MYRMLVRLHGVLRTSTRYILSLLILLLSVSFQAKSYRASRQGLPMQIKAVSDDGGVCVDILILNEKEEGQQKKYKARIKGRDNKAAVPGGKVTCKFEDDISCQVYENRFTCSRSASLAASIEQPMDGFTAMDTSTYIRTTDRKELKVTRKTPLPMSRLRSACCPGESFKGGCMIQ
eukprot:TRINITY_DN28660_c0_g1_i1.p1 TRINITY_DN28660_c0_g1~~TRINITY_DN28660_c0_g1_i1.p1  ORF type:complete len:176 (-),score=8.57 TRINITY_DN28660_c0_g1_i1:10-537(-)